MRTFIGLLETLTFVLYILILIRILFSFIRPGRHNRRWSKIISFLYLVTEPVLRPIRKRLPEAQVGKVKIDLSPIIVLIGLTIIRSILFRLQLYL